MTPSRFTRLKITVGYSLLLAVLLFSLFFIRREMEILSAVDDEQDLKTDSLLLLLQEKDHNTLQLLQVLSEANDSLLSTGEIEEIIAGQDSVITRQRVQRRIITKRDSLITKPKKKGFFKRLGEVFVPPKKDTAILVNSSLEFATDTILDPYQQTDSIQEKIREASQQKRLKSKKSIRRNNAAYQRMNSRITARVDSLIKDYELTVTTRAKQDAELQQEVRKQSTNVIGSIAIGALLLSSLFLVLIWRDISRSNRYRRELEEANSRAAKLLEAREKLMLAITHDFKAPLSSIMGYTELLSQLTENERQQFYLNNMQGSSKHLLKLVNDLLDFHRLDLNKAVVNRIAFDPFQLFKEIRDSFEPIAAAKGLTLRFDVAEELAGRYMGDPLRIRQIVDNLLSNAVKFTQKGSITLMAFGGTSKIIIKVIDTGKGMAAKDRERIFQEFTRLPGAQGEEGFGLGLSIVRKLVNLLEGSIDVKSELGVGTDFIVTLPLYPAKGEIEELEENKKESERQQPIHSAPLRVLLIDDDKIQLTLTAAMLGQQGIEATCCERLEELTEHLQTQTFDLLLTDIQMPAMNGFDLLRLLRASNIAQAKTIPVIAVTARSEMNESEFLEHGFVGCLHKPFTVGELLGIVGRKVSQPDTTSVAEAKNEQSEELDFTPLISLMEGDEEAERSLILTFMEQTSEQVTRMEEALENDRMKDIAQIAHKLLPIFRMIHASEAIAILTELEVCKAEQPTAEMANQVRNVLPIIRCIVIKAGEFLEKRG